MQVYSQLQKLKCSVPEFKIRKYKYLDTWLNTFQSGWPFPKVFGPFIHVYSLLPIIIDHINDSDSDYFTE